MDGSDSERCESRWRRYCPEFSGLQSEYKTWREQVEDWLLVCGEEVKYPGVEIRMSLKGQALEVAEGIDRDELKGTEGSKIILSKLDGVYLEDSPIENYNKIKNYFKIRRKSNEEMRDYLIRYEKAESECSRALGKSVLEGEVEGYHVLEQANLTENQKLLVLNACGQGKLEYKTVSLIMKRLFEGLGNKEEGDRWGSEDSANSRGGRENQRNGGKWNRGRGGRNPANKEGTVTLEEGGWWGSLGNANSVGGRENQRYWGKCNRGRGGRNPGTKERTVTLEEEDWWGSLGNANSGGGRENQRYGGKFNRGRGGRNPVNEEGTVTLCAICKSEWHWARECPQNFQNRKKTETRRN
ncbi:uncharacterized protein LOC135207477 [Macrobrachium nipponense]|uniref:uncharacterized protein LOC135207477 n=1 Tax=Macrobrachium nipponense TaxID=159736 RepID=UPI0030C7BCB9